VRFGWDGHRGRGYAGGKISACCLITSSIARSAKRRYVSYSKADFQVSRPARATRCTDWGEIWHAEGDQRFRPPTLLHALFHPHRCNDKDIRPPKLRFLLRFHQNVEYKRPAGAYSVRECHKICTVCTAFQDALAVKVSLDLLNGLWSYGGFKLTGSGYPKFSAPLVAKLCIRPPKVLEVQERA